MAIRIVTDSTADLPEDILKELDITVVSLHVLFGKHNYLDRVDIGEDEFYRRLCDDKENPTTTQPSPSEFAAVYSKLAANADGIISIHISGKLSGTPLSAQQGAKIAKTKCPIEVIDSGFVSTALGLITYKAAKLAKEGKGFKEIIDEVKRISADTHILVLFDTLEYLARGGRIGKGKSMRGSLLNVKPILTIKDGEFAPVSQTRSRSKGKTKLLDFLKQSSNIKEVALAYSTTKDELDEIITEIKATIKPETILIGRFSPVLGCHSGPGVIGVGYIENNA
jgi:DegV family protein with EDD domain